MRIFIINYEFPPLGGGGGAFCCDLAKELSKEHEVDVLTSHFKGLKKYEKLDKINISYNVDKELNKTPVKNGFETLSEKIEY